MTRRNTVIARRAKPNTSLRGASATKQSPFLPRHSEATAEESPKPLRKKMFRFAQHDEKTANNADFCQIKFFEVKKPCPNINFCKRIPPKISNRNIDIV
jgi:hypothetical protein